MRYSVINLNDSGITGGEASDITLGVNWYSTLKTRFSMNYIHVDSDQSTAFGDPDIL